MTRARITTAAGVVAGAVVVLVAAVLVWRATHHAPSAREQLRSRLTALAGVDSVRWSYAGSRVAVVRVGSGASVHQVSVLVRAARRAPCCQAVLYQGDARMEVDARARTEAADLFVALAGAGIPGTITVDATTAASPVAVRMRGTDLPTAFVATQRVVAAGSDRLHSLLVQTAGQDVSQWAVSADDLAQQATRSHLNLLLASLTDRSLAVERVDVGADRLTVRLHAANRAAAAVLWRRAGIALQGRPVDLLEVAIGHRGAQRYAGVAVQLGEG